MAVKTTQLRSIKASSIEDIELALDKLPFKVEIKYGPAPLPKGGWFISFVLPETDITWNSVDLRDGS